MIYFFLEHSVRHMEAGRLSPDRWGKGELKVVRFVLIFTFNKHQSLDLASIS